MKNESTLLFEALRDEAESERLKLILNADTLRDKIRRAVEYLDANAPSKAREELLKLLGNG